MLKRKNIAFLLLFVFIIPFSLVFSACEAIPTTHVHNYDSTPLYEVVEVGGSKVAKTWQNCSCGKEGSHSVVDNAVIVTPKTAQAELDKDINGKTIIFTKLMEEDGSGNLVEVEYLEELFIRPSAETTKAYEVEDEKTLGAEVALTNLDDTKEYHYIRELKNVTFASTDNVILKNGLTIENRHIYYYLGLQKYDAIRDLYYNVKASTAGHYTNIVAENINMYRLNFVGQDAKIYVTHETAFSSTKNITIANCSLATPTASKFPGAIHISCDNPYGLENVVVKNCYVYNHYLGVRLQSAKNATIINNVIAYTGHNNIGVYGTDQEGLHTTGKIIVENNIMLESGNQCFKFDNSKDCELSFKNNTIVNHLKINSTWTYVMQLGNIKTTSYTITDNTFNDAKFWEFEEVNKTLANIYIRIPGVDPTITV